MVDVGKQYQAGGHTVTFARQFFVDEPVSASLFTELNGRRPEEGDWLPDEVLVLMRKLAKD